MSALRIFLAHASEDVEYATDLVACLEKKFPDADIYFDQKLKTFENYPSRLGFEVATRPVFIVLLSKAAVTSAWVREETTIAIRFYLKRPSQRFILPTWIEDCDVDQLHPMLNSHQLIKCIGQPAQACCRKIADELDKLPKLGDDIPDPHLAPVPGGTFGMGDHETSQMLEPFSMGKYLVTVEDYARYLESPEHVEDSRKVPEDWEQQLQRPDHPVVNVDWYDANSYCHWLAQVTNRPFRLPNEAEWEKAARWDGRFSRAFPWSRESVIDTQRIATLCNTRESGIRATTPVRQYPDGISPCGAFDMAGNVWEWTSTLFTNSPFDLEKEEADRDTKGKRVIRGGSFEDEISSARCTARAQANPEWKSKKLGFRIAISGIFH